MKMPKEGQWTFEDQSVAECFDDHVREQLPWYDFATDMVAHFVRHYLPNNGVLYDIGASTGNISKSLSDIILHRNAKVIPIEPSEEMAKQYNGLGKVIMEKAEEHIFQEYDVAVLFLTVMFIPVADRKQFFDNLISKCKEGGCIIFFDKTAEHSGYLSTVVNRLTISGKVKGGAKPEDIINKELSLSGCQRPIDNYGHLGAKLIFRFGDFAGWIIEK